jgi:hypothetical protein
MRQYVHILVDAIHVVCWKSKDSPFSGVNG